MGRPRSAGPLRAEPHARPTGTRTRDWNWGNGAACPTQAYCDKFYNRTVDLINSYHPDLIYFDDTVLPLWPVSDVGLKIAAHFYNTNMQQHGGKLEAVLIGKMLDDAAAQGDGLGHRARRAGDRAALRLADRHLHRQLALRPQPLRIATVTKAPTPSSRCWPTSSARTATCCSTSRCAATAPSTKRSEAMLEGIAAWMDVNGKRSSARVRGRSSAKAPRATARRSPRRASTRARASRSPPRTCASRPRATCSTRSSWTGRARRVWTSRRWAKPPRNSPAAGGSPASRCSAARPRWSGRRTMRD